VNKKLDDYAATHDCDDCTKIPPPRKCKESLSYCLSSQLPHNYTVYVHNGQARATIFSSNAPAEVTATWECEIQDEACDDSGGGQTTPPGEEEEEEGSSCNPHFFGACACVDASCMAGAIRSCAAAGCVAKWIVANDAIDPQCIISCS